MKTRDEIGARVRAVITEHLSTTYRASRGTPDVTDDKAMNEDAEGENLGLDSLDLVEVTMAVEEDFDLELNDEKVAACVTVGGHARNRSAAFGGREKRESWEKPHPEIMRLAMGVDRQLTGGEIDQGIPPAYAEWVGVQLAREVRSLRRAA